MRLVNGRMAFANQSAFEQIRTELEQKSHLAKGEEVITAWEEQAKFFSLRTAAAQEEKHLEERERKHEPNPAHDLMENFGFPDYYAALLNSTGEYQVGDDIYWFHDGYKYKADSEAALTAIKKNPSSAKIKFRAGSHVLGKTAVSEKEAGGVSANRTVQSNYPFAYDKYTFLFDYQHDVNSKRRSIYATSVYSEDYGTDYAALTHYWYTTIYLLIKYEYYSFGSQKWYPAGEPFNWVASYNFKGIPSIPDQARATRENRQAIYTQGNFSNGQKTIQLGGQAMSSEDDGDPQRHSIYDITWDFEITGGLDSSPQYDDPNGRQYIGDTFNVPGPIIW